MQVNEISINVLAGTEIATRTSSEYAHALIGYLDKDDKVQRNYIRRIEKFKSASDDINKITERLIKYPQVKDMILSETAKVQTVLYECCNLTEAQAERVIKYVNKLKKSS